MDYINPTFDGVQGASVPHFSGGKAIASTEDTKCIMLCSYQASIRGVWGPCGGHIGSDIQGVWTETLLLQ